MQKSGLLSFIFVLAVTVMVFSSGIGSEQINKAQESPENQKDVIIKKVELRPETQIKKGITTRIEIKSPDDLGQGDDLALGSKADETQRLHPALSGGAGHLVEFWENIFYTDPIEYTLQMRSSSNNGVDWYTPTVGEAPGTPGYFLQDGGAALYPSLGYWGTDTRFYGACVTPPENNLGGDPQLIIIDDPMDETTWSRRQWGFWDNGHHDMHMAEIATNNTVEYPTNKTDEPFGVQGVIMSLNTYYHIPMLFYPVQYQGEHYGVLSWYTSLPDCRSIDAAIDDLGAGTADMAIAYSCFTYAEAMAGNQLHLYIRRDVYEYIVDYEHVVYPDPGEPQLYSLQRIDWTENYEHPVIDAHDDVIVIALELVDTDTPDDVDILSLSTNDGEVGNMQFGVIAASENNERYPEIMHIGGDDFLVVYWKDNQLYARKSSSGGVVFGTEYLVSDPSHVVPMDYRVADISDGGDKLIYSYTTPAKTEDIFLHIVDDLLTYIPVDQPPDVPEVVYPPDASVQIPDEFDLQWICDDADGDSKDFDIFMDKFSPPTSLFGLTTNDTTYHAGPLDPGETYYWQVVATDKDGTTAGPIWSFKTLSLNGCDNPLVVNLPADLPYSDVNYTCGRGDSVNTSCLDEFDNGEDILYQVNVTEEIAVYFKVDPLGFTNTGILLDDVCPPATDCLRSSTSVVSDPHGFSLTLSTGTYYLMIDTKPTPDCLPSFELTIEPGCCDVPGDANNDGTCNLGDEVFMGNLIFREEQCDNPPGNIIGCPPECPAEGDANADGNLNIGDEVFLGNFIFRESQCDNPPGNTIGCPPECGP